MTLQFGEVSIEMSVYVFCTYLVPPLCLVPRLMILLKQIRLEVNMLHSRIAPVITKF